MERPNNSLSGPRNNGPTAYARTKTEVVIATRTDDVIPNWVAICSDAGATMEDEIGDMNVNADVIAVAAHLR